jgi:predicted amidohydrolase YtcJ
MLIVGAERYPDLDRVDVHVAGGLIERVGRGLAARPGERVVAAMGGALLPGLHDHHLHLHALAARQDSVTCGPPDVETEEQLANALQSRPGSGWLRGVDYHESVAGLLDRRQLDAIVADRPVRIEHASGKMWFLNSAAVAALELPGHGALEGVECDGDGKPTGRLFRLDDWLRGRLAGQGPPDLTRVSQLLASFGVTGVTDTSPGNDDAAAGVFAAAIANGTLRQRLRMMGSELLTPGRRGDRLEAGEVKILLDEYALPDLDALIERVRRAHAAGRGAAFHCVTRIELVFALRALADAGSDAADRLEHASLTPADALPLIRECGATVVTQPGLIALRGDRYLADVDPSELPDLYRLGSFLRHGVPLGASTDAPYGSADPWLAMRAAVTRRTTSGAVIGGSERLSPEAALAGFLTAAAAPGGRARAIEAGAPADLCLLDRPWRAAREQLDAGIVRMTLVAGEPVFERAPASTPRDGRS